MSRLAGYGYQKCRMVQSQRLPGTFHPLVKYSGKELKKITNDAGLETTSCHFTWKEITDDASLAERIEFANQLGLKCMICSGGVGATTEDEVKKRCDQMNHVGEDGEERRHGCRIP
jgi:sugar phosphate isomerase/epimerase